MRLAEALITLGIIGVVAAISLPALLAAWDDQKQTAAKKKAMYTVANGYKKLATDNEVSMAGLPLYKCGDDFSCLSKWHKKAFSIASDQTKSHTGLPESYVRSDSDTEEAGFSWNDIPYIFTTADGMTFGYISGTKSSGIEIAVDINGAGEPNKICEDVYKINIDNKGGATETYKNGDKTQSLCTQLNDLYSPCTADSLNNGKTCSNDELLNLYNNAPEIYTSVRVYYGGEALNYARVICTSAGKVIALYEKEWDESNNAPTIGVVTDIDDYDGFGDYAQYCP